jgi:pimeloyl-ACP methyl ester carboxylesterase
MGGQGDPVVLLHGYPETSYAWRKVMPELAEHYTVIAPDLRGLGDSDKPASGYDKRTVAEDIYQLIKSLGFERIFLVGQDYGGSTAYVFAAEHPETVRRLVVIECASAGLIKDDVIPLVPGGGMWHRSFHLVPDLPESLIEGRERLYLSWFYQHYSRTVGAISEADIDEYVRSYAAPGGMHAGFEYYRTYFDDTERGREYVKTKLKMPVLAIGADSLYGAAVEKYMQTAALDVRGAIVENCGHFVSEEQPEALLNLLLPFFAEDTDDGVVKTELSNSKGMNL